MTKIHLTLILSVSTLCCASNNNSFMNKDNSSMKRSISYVVSGDTNDRPAQRRRVNCDTTMDDLPPLIRLLPADNSILQHGAIINSIRNNIEDGLPSLMYSPSIYPEKSYLEEREFSDDFCINLCKNICYFNSVNYNKIAKTKGLVRSKIMLTAIHKYVGRNLDREINLTNFYNFMQQYSHYFTKQQQKYNLRKSFSPYMAFLKSSGYLKFIPYDRFNPTGKGKYGVFNHANDSNGIRKLFEHWNYQDSLPQRAPRRILRRV